MGTRLIREVITNSVPTSPTTPKTAFLVRNADGSHERYVSDNNGDVSKQGLSIKGKGDIAVNGGVVEFTGVRVKMGGVPFD